MVSYGALQVVFGVVFRVVLFWERGSVVSFIISGHSCFGGLVGQMVLRSIALIPSSR